jgi:hypothetical protein
MDWKGGLTIGSGLTSLVGMGLAIDANMRSRRQENKEWKIVLQKFRSYGLCVKRILEDIEKRNFDGKYYYADTSCFMDNPINADDKKFLASFFHGKADIYKRLIYTVARLKREFKESTTRMTIENHNDMRGYSEEYEQILDAVNWAIARLEGTQVIPDANENKVEDA